MGLEISKLIRKLISDNFNKIAKETIDDGDGKLAYLSLSSKPEAIFRDEVGWMLQKELGEKYVVAREYKRYDLAILELSENEDEKGIKKLHHLIELKVVAAGIFRDKLKGAEEFVQLIDDDFEKRKVDKIPETKITSLVITYGVNKKVPNNQYAYVKYAGRHNGLFRKGYDSSKIDEVIKTRIEELLMKKSKSDYTVNKIGIAEASPFIGIGMNIYAYLITQSPQT